MNEIRTSFAEDLEAVQQSIARMCAIVVESINDVTDVLLDLDYLGVERLIENDDILDGVAGEVEERIHRTMLLQQPVAIDLRLLISSLKMSTDIERSGDLVVNVAKGVRRMRSVELSPETRGLIREMGEQAAFLFETAMGALVGRDATTAEDLHRLDDRLDTLQDLITAQVFEDAEAGTLSVQEAVQLCLIARFYERLGDHAVNVGEGIHFMVTGAVARPSEPAGADPQ